MMVTPDVRKSNEVIESQVFSETRKIDVNVMATGKNRENIRFDIELIVEPLLKSADNRVVCDRPRVELDIINKQED